MLGFDGLARQMLGDLGANSPAPQAFELLKAGPRALSLGKGLCPEASFDDGAKAVRFEDRSGLGLFYGVTEAGFDLDPPAKAVTHALEVEREFRVAGKVVSSAKLGQIVEVHIKARSLARVLYNVAFVDLLPAGFEVVVERPASAAADQARPAPTDQEPGENVPPEARDDQPEDQIDQPDGQDEGESSDQAPGAGMASFLVKGGDFAVNSADVREDRVLIFATVPPEVHELVYQIRATNQGKVQVPPLLAQSMYDPSVEARSLAAQFEVTAP
jgi:uncharacterized protein YfaS (alpha-2-macroglobulin family)